MAAVVADAQTVEHSISEIALRANRTITEAAAKQLLRHIGEDPTRDGLRDTPARVVRALEEMTRGYTDDPGAILSTTFDVRCDEMIVVRDVAFYSLCEHHLLPFFGRVHLGYVPSDRVVGLSKLARLVDCFARRLQVQERLTNEIADAMVEHIGARGAGVIVCARHLCMGARGVQKPDAEMQTSALRGVFREDAAARAEFLRLCGT